MDLRGKSKDDTQLTTVHQNTISTLRVFEGTGQNVSKFSSKYFLVMLKLHMANPFSSQRRRWQGRHMEGLIEHP